MKYILKQWIHKKAKVISIVAGIVKRYRSICKKVSQLQRNKFYICGLKSQSQSRVPMNHIPVLFYFLVLILSLFFYQHLICETEYPRNNVSLLLCTHFSICFYYHISYSQHNFSSSFQFYFISGSCANVILIAQNILDIISKDLFFKKQHYYSNFYFYMTFLSTSINLSMLLTLL